MAGGGAERSEWWETEAQKVTEMHRRIAADTEARKRRAKDWWLEQSRQAGGAAEPEREPLIAPGSAAAGSERKHTERGLAEEAELNEANVVFWAGDGPLGVEWRALRRGGDEDGFDDGTSELRLAVHRTHSPSTDPREPYEATAAGQRMLALFEQDEKQKELKRPRQGPGNEPSRSWPAFDAGAAPGFSGSFVPSPAASSTFSAARAERDKEAAARAQLMPGMVLWRLQGRLVDPTEHQSLKAALAPLQALRSGDGKRAPLHATFLPSRGCCYEAVFYERMARAAGSSPRPTPRWFCRW